MSKVKIGCIGAGVIARAHATGLKLIESEVEVTAVCDINQSAAQALADEMAATAYSSHQEMLAKENLDIALVCLPHYLHCPVGLDVLQAGVHLFIEKPMAVSTSECRELIACAERLDRSVFVGHTHQYRTTCRKARELIRSGAIGDPRIITTEIVAYYNWEKRNPWFLDPAKAGGGALFNTSPHQIDHLLYLIDSPIIGVRAKVEALRPGQSVDSDSIAFIEYENGAAGMFYVFQGTKQEEAPRVLVKIMGTAGSIVFAPFGDEVVLSKMDEMEKISVKDEDNPMAREWREFIQALRENRRPVTDGYYGGNVVAVLEAMIKSSATRATVEPEWM